MRTVVIDLETSSLYANSGIVLCGVMKTYGIKGEIFTVRADNYPSWKTGKSDNKAVIVDIMKILREYDIVVAHNGQYFDKAFLNSACLKYGLPPDLRAVKFIDPVLIARRHLRMARNSLASLIDYFDIQDTKTPIKFNHWLKAALDSNRQSMSYIVDHCVHDVKSLEAVYDYCRKLVKQIDDGGSAR